MISKPLLRSFAGGEIGGELFGRLDLDKFQTGVAKAENFQVLPHGPLINRAGTQWILEAKDSTKKVRCYDFEWSVDQTMALYFGDQVITFHTAGGTLLNTALVITGITKANPGVLSYTGTDPANSDLVYVSAINGMTELNGRWVRAGNVNAGANTFELQDLAGANIDTTNFGAWLFGGTAAPQYYIASPYLEADLMALHMTQSADVLTIVHPNYAPRELKRLGATNWTLTSITFVPTIAPGAAPTLATGGPGGGTPVDNKYVYTAIAPSTFEESIASPSSTQSYDLTQAGNFITIDPPAVTDAFRYNIYKEATGGLWGYIGQSDGDAFKDNNITPDTTKTPPEANNPFGSAGNYPSTVTYMEQRRCFAATDNQPQHIWMTRSGTESNMSQSFPIQEDGAIILRIAGTQQNRIRHLVPLGDLLALTAGSEFRIFSASADELTASSVTPKIQANVGCNNVQPVVAEASAIYTQSKGAHVREMTFVPTTNQSGYYTTNDISLLAPHLFDGYQIVDMAFSRAPIPTVWCVRSDGVLLGMTYVPGQNVRAWHHHTTDGLFESICCVSEGDEDSLYMVVQRTINGRSVRNYERMHTRVFAAQQDAFFIDCGLTYSGSATATISGLWHLEGKTVSILANGAVHPQRVVTGGQITLDAEATVVHVGLPITAVVETLPLTLETAGYGAGAMKNISKAHLRVNRSSSIFIGPTGGRLVEDKQRTNEPYGSPPALKTGVSHINLHPHWKDDGGVTLRQTAPLPLMIISMALETASG